MLVHSTRNLDYDECGKVGLGKTPCERAVRRVCDVPHAFRPTTTAPRNSLRRADLFATADVDLSGRSLQPGNSVGED